MTEAREQAAMDDKGHANSDEPDDFDYADFEELSDEEMAEEECGRWRNGKLDKYCTKAGSEECEWICPLRDAKA